MGVTVVPSAAHELWVAMVTLSMAESSLQTMPWARHIYRERPDLIQRVQSLWPDAGPYTRTGLELFAMAALLGYSTGASADHLLADLSLLPARVLAMRRRPPSHPDFPDIELQVRDRFEALLEPDRMHVYAGIAADIWEAVRPVWSESGQITVEAECALFRSRLADGADPLLSLPEGHIARQELFAAIIRTYLERGEVVIIPSFFSQTSHLYDFHGVMYIGYGLQTAGLRQVDAQRATRTAVRMKAFSDPTRLTILTYITQLPVTVGDLARLLDLSQPTVSGHLKLLRRAGLVTIHHAGTRAYYRSNPAAVATLLEETRRLTCR